MTETGRIPPGSMRMAYCPICHGNYYGSEQEHDMRFHGAQPKAIQSGPQAGK